MICLAAVLHGSTWIMGVLNSGLPPEQAEVPEGDEAPPAEPIVLLDAAKVLEVPMPFESEDLAGARRMGVMGGDTIVMAPLPAPVVMEYGDTAPPYQIIEVEPDKVPPGPAFDLVRRYLALRAQRQTITAGQGDGQPPKDAPREAKRTRLTS